MKRGGAATARRLVHRFGGRRARATLRRPVRLINPSGGVPTLELDGAHAEDATELALVPSSGSYLEGVLIAGAVLTIAGVTGTYTVASDAEASSNALTVTITAGLEGAAADGAGVTWTEEVDRSFACAVKRFRQGDIDGQRVHADDRIVILPTSYEPGEDELLFLDGEALGVVEIMPHRPGDHQGATRLHVGNR